MQRNNRKFIIGGGISGLVFSFYNPEFQIITPDVGGMFNKIPMIWLHDTMETRKFLTDLGVKNIESKLNKSYIGYFYKGWIHENLSKEINLILIQKKMTDWDKKINIDFVPASLDMSLSTTESLNFLNTLNVNLKDIIQNVAGKVNIVEGNVEKITQKNIQIKELTDSEVKSVEYKELISTIPAMFFWKMYEPKQEHNLKGLTVTLISTKEKPHFYDDKFEMIYYDDSVPYTRISKFGDVYTYEFTGEISESEFKKISSIENVINYSKIPFGRIFNNDSHKSPQKNINFLGRFSEWNYKIVTEHVIKKSIEYEQQK